MYDEERNFSWTDLFIKVIVALIIILFAVWLLSLSNRGVSNSLDVITDNIFSENIDKMKEVGKEYFTTERLPKKVGDVEKITLEKMYNDKMLLTLKDKKGNACSAKDSYVSVEKVDNEYQMKVYLECGKNSDYVIVTMGCYNYCKTDICEKNESIDDSNNNSKETINNSDSNVEYQYSKMTGGSWSAWGSFSNWSLTSISQNDSTDVETKVVKENYTYDKNVTENKFMGNATCTNVSGYTLVSNENGVCSYSKIETTASNPVCPNVSGYTLVNRIGFTCSYSGTSNDTKNPVCPSVSGYTFVSRNGFTCNYSKTSNDTKNPVCPSVSGYTFVSRNGFTCNYSKTTTSNSEYTLSYYSTGSGSYIPKDTKSYHYVQKSADYVYKCDNTCGMKWYYTYTIYKKVYKTISTTTTKIASCPAGYYKSGSTCIKSTSTNITKTASCSTGYDKSGNTCIKKTSSNITKEASCPNGYYKSGSVCANNNVKRITTDVSCPSGQTISNNKCYKKVSSVVKETGTKNVTYYRYRTRSYVGGTTDYKWSSLKNDKQLLDVGYKLTGKTRNKGTGEK